MHISENYGITLAENLFQDLGLSLQTRSSGTVQAGACSTM